MSKWFKVLHSTTNPKLRLFCFPYAGGSASVFAGWAGKLPGCIDLLAIQSPGRGARFSEPPINCLKTKVNILHKEILPYTNIPYIFIGHSNGALLAYELARELQRSGNCNLKHIIISAKRAPHLPRLREPIYNLSRNEFIKELKKYDFTPNEVLENEELMEVFLPMLRADFSLSDTYVFHENEKLVSEASLFWGTQDDDIPVIDVQAWRELILGKTQLVEFDGDHFFISKKQDEFINQINHVLNNYI